MADRARMPSVIRAVTMLFWREHRGAGALMLPYLVWVGFPSRLSSANWRMDPGLVSDYFPVRIG